MITLNDFLKNRDKQYPKKYTETIKINCLKTLDCTNKLLSVVSKDLNIKSFSCTSGWRPSEVNNLLPNADPNSPHVTGEGIDILDTNNILKKYIGKNPKLVYECGFKAIEDFKLTKTWIHLQTRTPLNGQKGKAIWNCILLNGNYVWQNNFTKEIKNELTI